MTIVTAGPGASLVFASASGGKVYAYNNISTTPAQVAPANTGRQKITFHNPGDVDILVAPSQVIDAAGSGTALTPSPSARGGCFIVFANGGEKEISGECQGAWQALAVSGSGKPLTVMDSNV